MHYASLLQKSKYKPSRLIIIGLVVAIVVIGGFPLFLTRKTSASGTRPTWDDTWEDTFAASSTVSLAVDPSGVNDALVATVSYRNLDGGFTDALDSVDLDGSVQFQFLCRQTGEGYTTEAWYVADLTAGSYTTNFTWNATVDDIVASVTNYSGVDALNPVGASACNYSSGGWSSTPDVSLTVPNDYSVVLGTATTYTGGDNNLDIDCGGSLVWNDRTTNVLSVGAQDLTPASGNYDFCWSGSNSWPWSTAAVSLNGIAGGGAVRGVTQDLWADQIFGRRDFTEISAGLPDAHHVSAPGGVGIYKNYGDFGWAYIWDSQNSRILGISLDGCYSDGSGNCNATMVIGQPSIDDHGACNHDSSFSQYPDRGPAGADTLCGMEEWIHTVLEDKTFTQIYVNQANGDLWVYDDLNNRVLRYDNPIDNDTTADAVWGQVDFTGDKCNLTGGFYGVAVPSPTDSSLCFAGDQGVGAGVNFDTDGNMWVADGGNNRILRFPNDCSGPCTAADIVIGQTDFTSKSAGSGMDQLQAPTSVSFDGDGRMYVADNGNNRVLTYDGPFTTGMSASGTFGSYSGGVNEVDYDSSTNSLFVSENQGFSRVVHKMDTSATEIATATLGNPGGGSIGFDCCGYSLATEYVYGQNAYRLYDDGSGNLVNDLVLFESASYHIDPTGARFGVPGWTGTTVIGDRMYAAEGRLLYWDNYTAHANGDAPDGYLNGTGFDDFTGNYTQLKHDNSNRLWALRNGNGVDVFDTPISSGDEPVVSLGSNYNLQGGGSITLGSISGIAPTPDGNYVWVTDTTNNRVVRIHNPLTDPVVDVVLGQGNNSDGDCNRGGSPALNTLCSPGTLSLDNFNNLYISDDNLEVSGNLRLLMFHADMFPDSPSSVIYGLNATKQFNKATFEVAFDSSNRMYAGYNPYTGTRFVDYFNDPTAYNPDDPTDQDFAQADGHVNDFSNWVIGLTVDPSNQNVLTFDANRGRVLVYNRPFEEDGASPSVSITSPADNATVAGSTDLTANASDNMALYKVVFDLDGTPVGTAYTSPYTVNINADDYSGSQTLTATAYDGAGNTNTDSITLNFSEDHTNPTVSITSPSNNASISGIYNVTTNAADNVAIDHVVLYVDGSQYDTVSNSPWDISWDTTAYSGGHNIYVIAYDTSGNSTQSATVHVTVLDDESPTGSITSPGDGGHVTPGSATTITASASDNAALNRVDFYVNGARKCAAVSTYTCTWRVPRAPGSYELYAIVIDAGGNTTQTDSVFVTSP